MKKLAISVILGSMLFSGNVMSSENYKPREFWDNTEIVKSTLEKAYNIACSRKGRRRFKGSNGEDRFWACEIAKDTYQSVTNFIERNCLEPLSMDDFLISLGLDETEEEPVSMEKARVFVNYVRHIIGKKTH